jgi:c-di-GMP-binding flagellar brake protein YcgR
MDQPAKQEVNPHTSADPPTQGFVNRRQFVRIYYPQECPQKFLPELNIHYRSYQILDISEGGIRFHVPHMSLIHDEIVTGTIKFPDNTFIEISGEIVRRGRNQIALKFIKGIPFSRIMSEQTRLRNLVNNGLITYTD